MCKSERKKRPPTGRAKTKEPKSSKKCLKLKFVVEQQIIFIKKIISHYNVKLRCIFLNLVKKPCCFLQKRKS